MSLDLITGSLVILVIMLVLWWLTRRPSGFPPGPPMLPFLGNLLSVDPDFRVTARKLRRQYGDIYSVFILNKPIIVLNGFSVLKESLVKNGDVFSDRPHSFLTDKLSEGKGVANNSGATWKEQRKFALSTLRDLGMGKSVLEDKIQEELSFFLKAMEDEKGQPFDCSPIVVNAVSNIICSMVFGKRFEYTDPLFKKFLHSLEETFSDLLIANSLDTLPIFQYLPGDKFRLKRILRNDHFLQNEFFKPNIEEHMEHSDGHGNDDFISAYIKEMKRRQQQGEDTSMDIENLVKVISDLFAAGTETTSTTIRWTLVYFLNYPDVQEKCFQEIKKNIGLSRSPSMKDKASLPYLEATIMEVLRYAQIAPTSVPHTVSQDVHFHGYTFPKGVTVLPMLSSVLEDPDIWGDPENFRPQRFLDDEGKVKKMEGLIPFSVGRRVCLGESLARMELFLFLTSMVQRYKFVSDEGGNPSMDGVLGITHAPKRFKLKILHRH